MKSLVDLHTHTVFSNHAYSSLTENIKEAYDVGLLYFGTSDHQHDDVGVGAHRDVFVNYKVIPEYYKEMRILRGIEMNVGEHFKESEAYYSRKRIDYAIASIHTYDHGLKHAKEENTRFYLEACNSAFVKILGHIDDGNHPCDYYEVIKACKNTKTLLEINNSSLRVPSSRVNSLENIKEMLKIAKEIKCPVIMNSDAHILYDVGKHDLAIKILEDNDFPQELIANVNLELFRSYFNI